MGIRDNINEAVQGLVDFGIVRASAVTDTVKQVIVTVLGVEDEDGNEQRSEQTLYGNAAVLLRPAAPDGETGMEVVFVRSGDDMVPIAHRETRWQVELEEGEVVIRALADGAARVRLKPDGTAVLEANDIRLGSDGASEGVPLGDSLKNYIDNHKHGFVDSVGTAATPTPGLTTVPVVAPPTPAGIPIPGSEDFSPDPSSTTKTD